MQSSGVSGGMGMDVDVGMDVDLDIDEQKCERERERQHQREQERIRRHEMEIEDDRIWAEKVLLLIVLTAWMIAAIASYLDGGAGASALLKILMGVYEFMLSYISFSQRVICDMISFIVGLVFVVLFSLSTITIIVLLSIPFIALIFAFTNI